ncbi:MAG: orotate phosphoribosyltransferase, partial [Planctomycetes bacterium]|nr:orotate phosphoribosyltransferase [Planctomycetota bacterium]
MTDAELAERIKEVSVLKGSFKLRSGRHSNWIVDKYAFETRPELLTEIARRIVERLPAGVSRIAGVELGGVPLATAVS